LKQNLPPQIIRDQTCDQSPILIILHRSASMDKKVNITPITLEGRQVMLSPLTMAHAAPLVAAASEGELWKTTFTIIPDSKGIESYIEAALTGQALGKELPFVIINKSSGEVVGTTRFYDISVPDRKAAIGYTWLSRAAQRTAINSEAKLLLLTHAFETWECVRVELITDVLNEQSRAAILRLGAKQEGILRKHLILHSGRARDSVVFSIIDSEWPQVKAGLRAKLQRQPE
ncbi:MAG TPA: GNAT family protein, partial [Pyrinomonadaceae bacterium]|nr:GNAT family protein [Pyrinomonadaceae bacterium]